MRKLFSFLMFLAIIGPPQEAFATAITFTSNRDGNQEVYGMEVDGSNQMNLTNNPADAAIPYCVTTG